MSLPVEDAFAPWSVFWRSANKGGCLASMPPDVRAALTAIWRDIAGECRPGDAVLDLATGDGIVLGHLAGARADLRLTGIDGADMLPTPSVPNVETIAGIPMEQLPFARASFALVTSQFGIEYGDRAAILREVGRVLAPGGSIAFVIHHRDSEVVFQNRQRGEQLRWVAFDNGMIDQARAMMAGGVPRADIERMVATLAKEGGVRHPGSGLILDFARSVQAVVTGAWPPGEGGVVLATLQYRARMEMARIDALGRSAHDAKDVRALASGLMAIGVAAEITAMPDVSGNGRPLAWLVRGNRRG